MKTFSLALLITLALISAPALATDLTSDCTSLPNFGATIGVSSSTGTFVTAIIPSATSASQLSVYTYTAASQSHGGPYAWSLDPASTVTVSGVGWGSPISTTPITSVSFYAGSASSVEMDINGTVAALTFQGMTTQGVNSWTWKTGLTSIDSSGPQAMTFQGYNGGGQAPSGGTVQAYGICSGVVAGYSPTAPSLPGQPESQFTIDTGSGSATTFQFNVDGHSFGTSTTPYLYFLSSKLAAGPHTLVGVAIDDAGHIVASPLVSFTAPSLITCVPTRTHRCPG